MRKPQLQYTARSALSCSSFFGSITLARFLSLVLSWDGHLITDVKQSNNLLRQVTRIPTANIGREIAQLVRRGRCDKASKTAARKSPRMVKTVHGLLRTPRPGSTKNETINGRGAARMSIAATR